MTTRDIILSSGGAEVPIVRSDFFRDFTPGGPKTKTPPAGALYMRVAIIGGGGAAITGGYASSGGGCASTKIVPASTITYTVGSGGVYNTNSGQGTSSTASFTGYSMTATAGAASTTYNSFAGCGVGTGGDYNYRGGKGINQSGGAAGPAGNGADCYSHASYLSGGSSDGGWTNNGWAQGGGGSGFNIAYNPSGGPGSMPRISGTSSGTNGNVFGNGDFASTPRLPAPGAAAPPGNQSSYSGGPGALLVEYFYSS